MQTAGNKFTSDPEQNNKNKYKLNKYLIFFNILKGVKLKKKTVT